jgi:hypothetical protein
MVKQLEFELEGINYDPINIGGWEESGHHGQGRSNHPADIALVVGGTLLLPVLIPIAIPILAYLGIRKGYEHFNKNLENENH